MKKIEIFWIEILINFAVPKTVVVAQLVRASDCDSEGRGFEPHHPPTYSRLSAGFYVLYYYRIRSLKPFILLQKPLLIQTSNFKVQI